jgi:multiple sugar transport system substrate-binding protein
MEESTIFGQPQAQPQPSQVDPSIQKTQQEQSSGQPVSSVQSGGDLPPQSPLSPTGGIEGEVEKKPSFLKKILKILAGVTILVFIALAVIVFIVPRFSGSNNEKAELTYWGLWEDQRVLQSVIDDFQKKYPNITVKYAKQDIKGYRERLDTRIKNGNGPDVFRFHNTWVPMISSLLLPIPSDVIDTKEFKSSFYPVAQRDLIKNGAIYGIPLEIDTLALYINSDIFQAAGLNPPITWEEFMSDAKAVTVKDESGKIKTAGAAVGTYSNIVHAPDIISLLFVQSGLDTAKLSDNSKKAAESLEFYTMFALDDGSVWDTTQDPSPLAFAKGNLGMYFGYSWDYFAIKAANPDLKFEIVTVPQLPDQSKTIASYWVEGVSSKSRHQKEALLFLKFLTSKESSEKIYSEQSKTRDFGEPYARVDLGNKLKDNPNIYPFISQANNAVSSYFADGTYDNGLNSKLNTYLGNAVNSILSNTSSETAVQTLIEGESQVLTDYGQ